MPQSLREQYLEAWPRPALVSAKVHALCLPISKPVCFQRMDPKTVWHCDSTKAQYVEMRICIRARHTPHNIRSYALTFLFCKQLFLYSGSCSESVQREFRMTGATPMSHPNDCVEVCADNVMTSCGWRTRRTLCLEVDGEPSTL